MYTEKVIYQLLSTDATVGPLVADGDGTYRIVGMILEEQVVTLPAIVYENDDVEPGLTMAGPNGLDKQTVKVSCLDSDSDAAESMAIAVKKAMENKSGMIAGVRVAQIFYKNKTKEVQLLPGMGDKVFVTVVTVEFLIGFYTPLPVVVSESAFDSAFSSAFGNGSAFGASEPLTTPHMLGVADSAQTRAALTASFPDNTTNLITAQCVRNLLLSIPLTTEMNTALAAVLAECLQLSGGAMAGNINMAGHDITNAYFAQFTSGIYLTHTTAGSAKLYFDTGGYLADNGSAGIVTFGGTTLDDGDGSMEVATNLTVDGNITATDINAAAYTGNGSGLTGLTKAQVGLSNVTNDAQLPLAGGTLTGDLTVNGRIGIHIGANLVVHGSISSDAGAVFTDGAGSLTTTTLTTNTVQTTNINTHYIATLLGLNFATGGYITDNGTGGMTATGNILVNGQVSATGGYVGLPVAPEFKIVAGNLVFTNLPASPVTLKVFKYTRHKSTSGSRYNKAHTTAYSARQGKRYYLMQTMTSFSGTWHITDTASTVGKSGHNTIQRGVFRFAYLYPGGVIGPHSAAVEAIRASGGASSKARIIG